MWIVELFGEGALIVVDRLIDRIRGWRAYRRLYGAAERREHRRRLDARPPRGPLT